MQQISILVQCGIKYPNYTQMSQPICMKDFLVSKKKNWLSSNKTAWIRALKKCSWSRKANTNKTKSLYGKTRKDLRQLMAGISTSDIVKNWWQDNDNSEININENKKENYVDT